MHVSFRPGYLMNMLSFISGETGLLSKCQAPKVLSLKVGAPVILLKNMTKGLCNGTKGIVQSIDGDDPIINFNGKLYTLSKVLFEVFDTRQDKVRASRFQYPLKLAFCLTVHKAQGRTEPYLEVDCFSFFAPGQLGVAIGRAVSIKNLRVRNYSPNCATIKHLPHVYEFYDTCDIEGTGVSVDDFSCCRPEAEDGNRTGPAIPPTTDEPSVDPWANVSQLSRSSPSQPQHDDMFDLSECPPPEGITVNQERLVQYVGSMHDTVSALLPRDGQGKDAWASAFRLFHQYLLSVEYKQRLCLLFETTSVSPVCNRYATKLAFSVHHAIVAARADAIRERNENAGKCSESPKSHDLSDIAKAKIRYLAGACMSRITTRLRGKALSDITNTIHSTSRKHAYDQHKLLAGLRVSETHVTASTSEPASLSEIDYKQSSTRGLFHIPDNVFHFFLELHVTARMYLTHSNFDAHQGNAFTVCRQKVFDDAELHRQWCALFPLEETRSDLENELSQGLINELYNQVAEHYIRICFVDALHEMKEKLPKTKKQALRAKIEGATKVKVCVKPEQKRKNESIQMFHCPVCKDICVEEPQSRSESSIGCDGCNEWFHLPCAKVSNPKKIKKWFCVGCTK